MMKKKSSVFLIIGLFVITFVGYRMTTMRAEAENQKQLSNISEMMQGVVNMSDPKVSISSNPYDYTIKNKAFDGIVNLGSSALPVLKNKIQNSTQNGLEEYLFAIAMEKIAKVDLKGDKFGWADSKEFCKVWDEHLKAIPQKVTSISNSDDDNKADKLIKLGTPSIPFIMDEVEQGNIEVIPALDSLLEGSKEVNYIKGSVNKEWIQANKQKFDGLRKIVNDTINKNGLR
jgi:hypothetical protein